MEPSLAAHPLRIIVDDREVNTILLEKLQNEDDILVIRQRLKAGDYLFNETLLFERKTICDFCASIKDGRLFAQAAGLSACGLTAIFILEGTAGDMKTSNIKREALQGALTALMLKFNIPVLRTMGPEETAWLMLEVFKQMHPLAKRKYFYYRAGANVSKKNGQWKKQIHILQGFPGIGPGKAERLLSTFGTLHKIFNATDEQLYEVRGIGKTIVAQLKKLLHEQ